MTASAPPGPAGTPHGHARAVRSARALALAEAAAEGLLPLPRDPLEAARQALVRALQRGAPALDEVRFTAACPGCGQDCEWRESRVETRLRIEIGCAQCPAEASAVEQPVPPVVQGLAAVLQPDRGA